jgi:2-hydroxy-6-oxonona-2,4-dienedioate hydrolase
VHGLGEKPPRVLGLSGLSDALACWMRAMGLEDAALVGNSLGCQVVADLAVRHPRHVGRAVLQGRQWTPRRVPPLGRRRGCCSPVPANRLPRRRHAARIPGRGVLSGTRTFRYAPEDRVEDRLPEMGIPTPVVRGSRDPIAPQRWAEAATRLLPAGWLVMLPGAAHTADYGSPSECARMVRAFLDGDRGASEKAR